MFSRSWRLWSVPVSFPLSFETTRLCSIPLTLSLKIETSPIDSSRNESDRAENWSLESTWILRYFWSLMQPLKVQAPFSTLHFKSISRRISPCCVFSSLMTSHVAGKLRSILFRSARFVYATERLRNISIKKEFLIDNWVTLKEFLIDNWQLVERFMFDCDGDSRRIKKKKFHFQREVFRDAGDRYASRSGLQKVREEDDFSCVSSNDTRMVRATLRVYLVKESAMPQPYSRACHSWWLCPSSRRSVCPRQRPIRWGTWFASGRTLYTWRNRDRKQRVLAWV